MASEVLISLGREAILLAVLASLPPLTASLLAGFLASLLQAATQLQESTLSLVPKLLATLVALVVFGPWISAELGRFTARLLQLLPEVAQ